MACELGKNKKKRVTGRLGDNEDKKEEQRDDKEE